MKEKKLRFKEGDKVYWVVLTDFGAILHEGEIVATDRESGRHVCVDKLMKLLGCDDATFVLPDGDENYYKTKWSALHNPPSFLHLSED